MAHKDRKISFVETSNLKVLRCRLKLKALLLLHKLLHKPLKDYDLSRINLKNLDFSDLKLENVVFNYFDVEKKKRKEIFNVNFQGCTMNRVSFAHCSFCRCNFDSYSKKLNLENEEITVVKHTTTMNECDFFFCEFEKCRFINTKMEWVDFRYSSFTDCSMRCAQVKYGDFYMTAFHGTTNFPHSVFSLCSLTNVTFDNHCLLMENIDRLIQENYELYSIFIRKKNWSKHNPCADFSELDKAEEDLCKLEEKILEEKIYIAQEAKFIYTTLSGLYSGKGLFRDSNKAYSKAKKCEAQYYKLLQKKAWQRKEYRSWLKNGKCWVCPVIVMLIGYGYACWSWLKNGFRRVGPVIVMLFGYGYKPWPVIAWFAFLIVFFWMKLWFAVDLPWNESLAASICNSIGTDSEKMKALGHVLASLETLTGTLLIGYLGFVIANKIRNNS